MEDYKKSQWVEEEKEKMARAFFKANDLNFFILITSLISSVFLFLFKPDFMVNGNPVYGFTSLFTIGFGCLICYKVRGSTIAFYAVLLIGFIIWAR